MEKIISSLKKLGLTRYEALAYIGLTKLITSNADEIAEVSNVPRSKIYEILNELERKGFVEIERIRPLKYTAVEPEVIFKKEKDKFIADVEESESRLEEIYKDKISEVQAPVWLIRNKQKILNKEAEVIKKATSSITIKMGFLLEGEAEMMIKTFKEIPRSVKIKIIANEYCYINDNKYEILNKFKNAKLSNLEIIKSDLPVVKILICDGREIFGTFANFTGNNNSILPETAVGVCNQYEAICETFEKNFQKQFNQLNSN